MNGAEALCAALREQGATVVFGLPGTQNIPLYEAVRTTGLAPVVASDEGAAAFMAAGYARAGGQVAVLATIPGPGFLYALPGIAEARDDSAAVLWITLSARRDGQAFPLQSIDQPAIAAPLVKAVRRVERATDVAAACREAWCLAAAGEPGPVLLELADDVLVQDAGPPSSGAPEVPDAAETQAAVDAVLQRLHGSVRPLIIAGQGAQGAADAVRALAHQLKAPVLFTCSGRGVLADDDPRAFVQDFSQGLGEVVAEMLEAADLILVLGCKFTHNGSAGGRLSLPAPRLVRVDSSAAVLSANYPASLAVHARCEAVVPALAAAAFHGKAWEEPALQAWRERLAAQRRTRIAHEPQVVAPSPASAGRESAAQGTADSLIAALFDALGRRLGETALYTADAGLHQVLARRYARVLRARGLLCPSDFQSMGFGLAGAIGAALAQRDARVVACVGDGGFALSAGDLYTAVRLGLRLTVIVFNDRSFGLIRRQQVANYGYASGVDLAGPDYAQAAAAAGCGYLRATTDMASVAAAIADAPGVMLVELRLSDAPSFAHLQKRAQLRARLRGAVPAGLWRHAKRLLGR